MVASGRAASKRVRVVVIGAGSYVFSVGLLHDLIIDAGLPLDLTLVDPNTEVAENMAGVARRMAESAGADVRVDVTADRIKALRGAHFVTNSAAVQLQSRYEQDLAVIAKHGLREIASECGGVGGLAYALRTVPLALGIARDMEAHCPDAWLLNVSNPLPRVITALSRHSSIKSLGFCNVAQGGEDGYGNVAALLNRNADELDVTSAGLNHFAWLLAVRDKQTGEDLLPTVYAALNDGAWSDRPLSVSLWQKYGVLPLSGDSHIGEYLPFDAALMHEHTAYHGTTQERAGRLDAVRQVAQGQQPWQVLMEGRSWERPSDVIAALAGGKELHLDMVNLVNGGHLPGLPDNAVVELPAQVSGGQVTPLDVPAFPEELLAYLQQVSHVHDLAAEAAATGEVRLVDEAVLADPAIPDKRAGLAAIHELLRVHADVLTQFGVGV